MKSLTLLSRFVLLFLLVLTGTLIGSGAVAQAQGGQVQGPNVGPVVKPVSMNKDLRKMPKPTKNQGGKHGIKVQLPTPALRAPLLPGTPDPVRQTSVPSASAPNQGQNFQGAGGDDPPDDNGAVGTKYFAQTTNFNVGFYDKATGTAVSVVNINTFWSNAGAATGTACDANNNGDPVALYDGISDRFIITDFAWTDFFNGPYYECIAVAKTSDPISGGWWLYALRADDNSNKYLNDYPKLGVWPDGYYMMADMFDEIPCSPQPCNPTESFKFVRVWALNRATMVNGGAMSPISFDVSGRFSMVPTNWNGIGTAPPAGTPNYFGVVDYQSSTNTIHVYRFHADFATPANSWFGTNNGNTNPVDVTVPAFNKVSQNIPQKGTSTVFLDSLGNRLMYQFQYRNIGGTESLWAAQTVDAGGGVNGVRWYQLNVTGGTIAGSQVQAATYSPDSTHRWMPHLAVDQFGDMALGYSASSSTIYPDIRYTGRLAGDAANTLQSEATLFSSSNAFVDCSPTAPATTCTGRWGDYSSVEVDPVDDCTFWFTTEYVDAGGNAVTRIGSFRFNSACAADVSVIKTAPATVIAGNDMTYNLTVANGGPVTAQNVALSDSLPAGTSFVSLTQNTGPTFSCSGTSTIDCSIASLANGASATFSLVVNVGASVPNGTTLSNTATVSTSSSDPNTANNSSTATTTVQTSADLAVNKTAAVDPAIAGTNETYNLTLTNNGPSDAQSVSLTDATPANTTFVSLAQNTGPAFACVTPAAGASGTVTCTRSTLAAGASATFTFVVKVSPAAPDGSTLSNTVAVTSTTSDPNPANNSKTITTGVIARADVGIVKKGKLSADHSTVIWTLTVNNAGPSNANAVTVQDSLVITTLFAKVTTTKGSCTGGSTVKCSLGTMGPGTSATITITAWVVKSAIYFPNTATVTSSTTDPNLANNSSSFSIYPGSTFDWNFADSRF